MSFTLFPMPELCSVTTPDLKCLFAMVNRIKYTHVSNIVDYFKDVHKMLGPIMYTSMVTWIAMNLGCLEMANFAYILFTCTSYVRNPIILYLCCMDARRSGYLTRPFDCIFVRVLHFSLIAWERHTTTSQDHLTLTGEIAWRQHSRTQLHHMLTLKGPSGTLGMGVTTQVTMR
jgi:hypothetical protein